MMRRSRAAALQQTFAAMEEAMPCLIQHGKYDSISFICVQFILFFLNDDNYTITPNKKRQI